MAHDNILNLFVEFLLNIRQATIYVKIDVLGSDGQAEFFADRQRLGVSYGNTNAVIAYPSGISGTALLHIPINVVAQLSLRLEIENDHGAAFLQLHNQPPWSGQTLGEQSQMTCRQCDSILIPKDSSCTWTDLSEQHGALHRELWHCHEHETADESHSPSTSSDGTAGPGPGERWLDLYHVLINKNDASSFKVGCVFNRAVKFFRAARRRLVICSALNRRADSPL
jgi:ubiquitin-protein ligase E3 D